MNLIEFPCPECDTFLKRSFAVLRQSCNLCGGSGKVLVKREDLIKVTK